MEDDLKFTIQLGDENSTQKQTNVQNQSYAALAFEQESIPKNKISDASTSDAIAISNSSYDLARAGHPYACVATFIFKLLALFSYLFLNVFVDNSAFVFIIVVLFSAADFWTVKNVTGRLLVGLKWFSEHQDDGTEIWKYESHDNTKTINGVDSAFFWTSQIISTVLWGFFTFINILSLNVYWTSVDIISVSLSGTNFYGFYKCRGEHQKKVTSMKSEIAKKGLGFLGNMMINQSMGNQ